MYLRVSKSGSRSFVLAFLGMIAVVAGSVRADDEPADDSKTSQDIMLSSCDLLIKGDFKYFQAGRQKAQILDDIQWRGSFIVSTRRDDHRVTIILYNLVEQDKLTPELVLNAWNEIEESVWAIFIDEKFVKFVRPPEGLEEPTKIDDFSWYLQSIEFEPVDIAAMQKDVTSRPDAPSQTDPGLTAAALLLKAVGALPPQGNYQKNQKLRNQFNAARL